MSWWLGVAGKGQLGRIRYQRDTGTARYQREGAAYVHTRTLARTLARTLVHTHKRCACRYQRDVQAARSEADKAWLHGCMVWRGWYMLHWCCMLALILLVDAAVCCVDIAWMLLRFAMMLHVTLMHICIAVFTTGIFFSTLLPIPAWSIVYPKCHNGKYFTITNMSL